MAAFTDRYVRSLKPAPPGKRVTHWDDGLRSFGIRVTENGSATYLVMRRVKGKLVRHNIGRSWKTPGEPSISLAEARKEARTAIADMTEGVDPRWKRAGQAVAEVRHAERAFAAVAEDFIVSHVSKLRSAKIVSAAIRNKLISAWGERPITDVSRSDVIRLIRKEAQKQPDAAASLLAFTRKLFAWAVAQDCYDLQASPCVAVSANALIGERKARERVLSDVEISDVWRASIGLGYPFGDLVRLLLLTGQRLRECAEATWDEIDLNKKVWSLPSTRMKSGAPHEVPLSATVIDLLSALPRWQGPHLFSTMDGIRPVSGFSKAKIHLDKRLGDMPSWRFHDLRRSVRTQLGALGVPPNIAELVIGHAQPGMHKVYDRYRYLAEKRAALETWADRLAKIVEPKRVQQAAQ